MRQESQAEINKAVVGYVINFREHFPATNGMSESLLQ